MILGCFFLLLMILLVSCLLREEYKSRSCNWRGQDVHPGDKQGVKMSVTTRVALHIYTGTHTRNKDGAALILRAYFVESLNLQIVDFLNGKRTLERT